MNPKDWLSFSAYVEQRLLFGKVCMEGMLSAHLGDVEPFLDMLDTANEWVAKLSDDLNPNAELPTIEE